MRGFEAGLLGEQGLRRRAVSALEGRPVLGRRAAGRSSSPASTSALDGNGDAGRPRRRQRGGGTGHRRRRARCAILGVYGLVAGLSRARPPDGRPEPARAAAARYPDLDYDEFGFYRGRPRPRRRHGARSRVAARLPLRDLIACLQRRRTAGRFARRVPPHPEARAAPLAPGPDGARLQLPRAVRRRAAPGPPGASSSPKGSSSSSSPAVPHGEAFLARGCRRADPDARGAHRDGRRARRRRDGLRHAAPRASQRPRERAPEALRDDRRRVRGRAPREGGDRATAT